MAAPRKRRARAPRCSYREGNRRCPMDAVAAPVGQERTPPLCRAHRVVLQTEAERRARPGGGLADVISGVVNGKPISTDALFGAVADLFGVFGARAAAQPQASYRPGQGPPPPPNFDPFGVWGEQQRQRQQRAEQAAPTGPTDEELARARKVFGYVPGETVTKDELKKRYRKLSFKHHPDRKGGSVSKMAEINHSHDLLQAFV